MIKENFKNLFRKLHCIDYLNFAQNKWRDRDYIMKAVTITASCAILLSIFVYWTSNEINRFDNAYSGKARTSDRFIAKNDDVVIYSYIDKLVKAMVLLDTNGNQIEVKGFINPEALKQAYYYWLFDSGKINNYSSQEEIDNELKTITNLEIYQQKIGTTSVAISNIVKTNLFKESERLRRKQNNLFIWLIIVQIINIVLATRLPYLDRNNAIP